MENFNSMVLNKSVVILRGPSECGKTSSIKLLTKLFPLDEFKLIYRAKKWVERLEIYEYNDFKIGVSSRSDRLPLVKENIFYLIESCGCNVIIIAINERTRGVNEFIFEYFNDKFDVYYIDKYPEFCDYKNKGLHQELNLLASIRVWKILCQVVNYNDLEVNLIENKERINFLGFNT